MEVEERRDASQSYVQKPKRYPLGFGCGHKAGVR